MPSWTGLKAAPAQPSPPKRRRSSRLEAPPFQIELGATSSRAQGAESFRERRDSPTRRREDGALKLLGGEWIRCVPVSDERSERSSEERSERSQPTPSPGRGVGIGDRSG